MRCLGNAAGVACWTLRHHAGSRSFLCAPADLDTAALKPWVRFWKSHVAKNWNDPTQLPIWQRDFWDTQLRKGENYDEKWRYVLENPVRAGLVKHSEDWPYQGELNVLEW